MWAVIPYIPTARVYRLYRHSIARSFRRVQLEVVLPSARASCDREELGNRAEFVKCYFSEQGSFLIRDVMCASLVGGQKGRGICEEGNSWQPLTSP